MHNNPLRLIRKRLQLTQKGLANKLGVLQQTLSIAERSPNLTPIYRKRLLDAFPEKKELILETIEGGTPRISSEDIVQAARQPREPVPESSPIEDKALPWAVTFRTNALLDRLSHLARCAGLQPRRLPDYILPQLPYGLLLTEGESKLGEAGLGDVLFPGSGAFGLKAGTVVLLGSPYRRANPLLEVLLKKISVRFDFHIPKSEPKPSFYFGYPTTFVDLRIEGKWYRPNRYIDEHDAVYYEDYGVLLYAPLAPLVEKGESPFGKAAVRVVLVAGAHRLATGTGMRLLEDLELRRRVFKEENDFEGFGMLAFRVVVRNGDFSTVEELEMIKRWKRPSVK